VLKTSLVNLMSYSPAPVVWGRENLGIGGCVHLVRRQSGVRTRTDARHARVDAPVAVCALADVLTLDVNSITSLVVKLNQLNTNIIA
jgi:hypothetical protein